MYHLVFMGSPGFALPILRSLAEQYNIVGVVTQPDRPAGRGRVLTPPPIKILADELHLAVIQPHRLSDPDTMRQLRIWAPDFIVVCAFGQILRPDVLDLPHYGCINVHASLLPRWRGAAPIQAAILNGDEQTGVTIMKMDPGVDTGPIMSQCPVPISRQDTTGSLASKLSDQGAQLLVDTLPQYLNGSLTPVPQDNTLATYAPMIKKEQGLLDFSQPAILLERKIRAYNPWPGAFDNWNHQLLKIHHAHVVEAPSTQPGQKIIYGGWPAYSTGEGILVIDELQPAGKNKTNGKSFLQGARNWGQEFYG
jgi:methionyl-tRNA formyltransferase